MVKDIQIASNHNSAAVSFETNSFHSGKNTFCNCFLSFVVSTYMTFHSALPTVSGIIISSKVQMKREIKINSMRIAFFYDFLKHVPLVLAVILRTIIYGVTVLAQIIDKFALYQSVFS